MMRLEPRLQYSVQILKLQLSFVMINVQLMFT